MGSFVPNLAAMLRSDVPFKEYFPAMIETVIDTMLENPQIPIFVLQELSSNPDRMPQIMKEMGIDPSLAIKKMAEEGQVPEANGYGSPAGDSEFDESLHFSFCSPICGYDILFDGDNDAYIAAMEERKKLIPQIVKQIMK